jgi:hypothetical protein
LGQKEKEKILVGIDHQLTKADRRGLVLLDVEPAARAMYAEQWGMCPTRQRLIEGLLLKPPTNVGKLPVRSLNKLPEGLMPHYQ